MKSAFIVLLTIALMMAGGCQQNHVVDKAVQNTPAPVDLDSDLPMGILGHPIGQLVLVEGTLTPSIEASNTLVVDAIDGHPVSKPVEILVDNAELPKGQRCLLRGYESLRMVSIRVPAEDQIAELKGDPVWPHYEQVAPWYVSYYFVVLEAVQPKTLKVADGYETELLVDICAIAKEGNCDDEQYNHAKAILTKYPQLVNARHGLRPPPEVPVDDDFTPLYFAAMSGNERFAELLLSKGATVNITAYHGITPLHCAAEKGNLSIVKLLVAHGADIKAKTQAVPAKSVVEFSPMDLAAFLGLAPGESPDPSIIFPEIPAQSALDMARQNGHSDVVDYLQSVTK